MLMSLSSNAIATKAKALYGKRLKSNNYTDLLRLNNIPDVCSYLKTNTNYSKYLKGVNESAIHRGQLESLLNRSRIEKFTSLCHYDFTHKKGFYRYVISNIEVQIILNAILFINLSSNEEIIPELPSFVQEYACFNFMELSKIKSFDDLLKVLEHTPYKNVIKIYKAPNGSVNFKDCEFALKTNYYKNILNEIDKQYKGKLKRDLTELVKIEVELLNLSLIYRLKNHFNRSAEEIARQIIPIYYKFTPKSIDTLVNSVTTNDYIQGMRLNIYSNKMKDVEFNYIEDYTKRLKYIISKKYMRFSTKAPICFYALMSLIQIEIENLITIIEGIRYNDTGSEIQKLLILE